MYEKECVPYAPMLIESMRALGYSFPTAIADLIDNSISAGAKNISIITNPGDNPFLIIIDDGCGMDNGELYEAMRYGSSDPNEYRDENDLGRFGLGLKSASLSQCRNLVVVSKCNSELNSYSWNLDYVVEKGSWLLKGYNQNEINNMPYIDKLNSLSHGTYVYLDDFDKIKHQTTDVATTFNRFLNDMIEHLSLVFHRFLEDGLKIDVNGIEIKPKDPFLTGHKATQRKREKTFAIDGQIITLKPYILPHVSKLSDMDLMKVGGKERLKNDQGFYIYRNKRLIIWGTWFRLERKEELNKLARVRVDIPNSLDYMWSIDVKKSTATLPDKIKRQMYNAVYESVLTSEKIHTFRGKKERPNDDIDYVWDRVKVRDGYSYVLNRDLPLLKMLIDSLDDKQYKLLNNFLNTIETTFPSQTIYIDGAKGNLEHEDVNVEEIWDQLQENIQYVKDNNMDVKKFYEMFLNSEPYCKIDEIKDRINKEMLKYE